MADAQIGRLLAVLGLDDRQFQAQLKSTERLVRQTASTLGRHLGTLATAAAGIATGVITRDIIRETLEAERVSVKLAQAITSTGRSARLSSAEVKAFASDMQRVTTFSDEAVSSLVTLLLPFRNIGESVLPRASKAILDFATFTGRDATQAAKLFGVALNDPVKGMGRLRQAGISLDAATQKTIKGLVESGNLLQAHGVFLDELEKSYQGAAEAARNTLGGALEALKNRFGDLLEQDSLLGVRTEIERLIAALDDPAVARSVDAFGVQMAAALRTLAGAAAFAVEHIDALKIGIAALIGFRFAGPLGAAAAGLFAIGDEGERAAQVIKDSAAAMRELQSAQGAAIPTARANAEAQLAVAQAVLATAVAEQTRRDAGGFLSPGQQSQIPELRGTLEVEERRIADLRKIVAELGLALLDLGDAGKGAFSATAEGAEEMAVSVAVADKAVVAAHEAIEQQIAALQNQIALNTLDAKTRAEVVAVMRVQETATKAGTVATLEHVEAARMAAGALHEQEAAIKAAADAQAEAAKAAEQLARDAAREAEERAKILFEPIENAIENVQRSLSDAIFNALDGGIKSFKDFANSVLDIIKRLASEVATLLIFRPVLGGLVGAGSGGGGFGGLLGSLLGQGGGSGGITTSLVQSALSGIGKIGSALGSIAKIGSSLVGLTGLFGASAAGAAGISAVTGAGVSIATGAAPLIGSSAISALGALGVGTVGVGTGVAAAGGGALGGIAGALAVPGVGLLVAAVVSGVLATISSIGTFGAFLQGKNPFLGGSREDASFQGSMVDLIFGGTGGFIGAIIGAILHETAQLSRVQLSTRPVGSDPSQFQGGVFEEGPFGIIGMPIDVARGFNEKAVRSLVTFFAAVDEQVARILDPDQIAAVASHLQSTEAQTLRFREFNGEIFKVTLDRLNEMFKVLVGPNLAIGATPNAKRTAAGDRLVIDNIELQAQLAKLVTGKKKNREGTQQLIEEALAFLQQRQNVLDLLKEFEGQAAGISEAAKAIEQVEEQFRNLKFQMEDLEFSAADLARAEAARVVAQQKLREGFAQGVEDQILAITNPFELAARELKRLEDERMKNAIDFGSDLLMVEKLNLLERQRLLEEHNRPLKDLLTSLSSTALGGDAPLTLLAGAEARVNEIVAALPTGGATLDEFAAAAVNLLGISQDLFSTSEQFQQRKAFILALAQQLQAQSLPGFASGGSFMVPGGGVDNVVPLFRASGGERITAMTRGQQAAERLDLAGVRLALEDGNAERESGNRAVRDEISALRGVVERQQHQLARLAARRR